MVLIKCNSIGVYQQIAEPHATRKMQLTLTFADSHKVSIYNYTQIRMVSVVHMNQILYV